MPVYDNDTNTTVETFDADKWVCVLTVDVHELQGWNYVPMETDSFLDVFANRESALSFCVGTLGMKVIVMDDEGVDAVLEPTHFIDRKYTPYNCDEDDFELREFYYKFKLTTCAVR